CLFSSSFLCCRLFSRFFSRCFFGSCFFSHGFFGRCFLCSRLFCGGFCCCRCCCRCRLVSCLARSFLGSLFGCRRRLSSFLGHNQFPVLPCSTLLHVDAWHYPINSRRNTPIGWVKLSQLTRELLITLF